MLSDAELQGYKQHFDANTATLNSQKPKTQKKKVSGIKGFLANALPLVGGAIGGIGGSLVAPVAGTAAGGAAGAGLGEFLKEKLTGEKTNLGHIAEQGAFGALPGVGKLARAGVGAVRAARAGEDVLQGGKAAVAAKAIPETVVAPKRGIADKVLQSGIKTEARTGGFGQGEKQAGKDALGFYDSANISKTLAKHGIKGGSASARQRGVDDALANARFQIDESVAKGNKAFKPDEAQQLAARVHDRILGENGTGIAGFNPDDALHVKVANNYASKLAGVKDTKGLLNFKRSLDKDAINYNRNSNAPDPIREATAKAFRAEVNSEFGKRLPEAKAASGKYADLTDANEFLKQASRDASNAATQSGGGWLGRVLTSDTAESAKSKAGILAQKVAKKAGGSAEPISGANVLSKEALKGPVDQEAIANAFKPIPVLKKTVGQAVAQGTGNALFNPQQPQQPGDNTSGQDLLSSLSPDASGSADQADAPQNESPLADPQKAQAAFVQALASGNIDAAKLILSAFDSFSKAAASASGSAGPNVTKVTAQQYGLAQTGMTSLQQLNDLLQKDPSALTRSSIPGRGLPIVGGYIGRATNTTNLDTIGYNIADSILRLRTGATANSDEVKKLQNQLIPRAGNSPEEVATKLKTIQNIFSTTLNQANGSNSGTDLSTLAGNLGY